MGITILVNEKRWSKLRKLERSVGKWFCTSLQNLIENPEQRSEHPWFWMIQYRRDTTRDPFHQGWMPFSKFIGGPLQHRSHKTIQTPSGLAPKVRELCEQLNMSMGELIRELLEDRCLSYHEFKRKLEFWKGTIYWSDAAQTCPDKPDPEQLSIQNSALQTRVNELERHLQWTKEEGRKLAGYIISLGSTPSHLEEAVMWMMKTGPEKEIRKT